MTQVVALDDLDHMFDGSPLLDPLQDIATVTVYTDHASSEAETVRRLEGAEVVVLIRERTPITRSLLEQLPALRLIAQTGRGLAHIDVEAARERGVAIATTPGGSAQSVAELAVGLMLACLRSIAAGDRQVRTGVWQPQPGTTLQGKQLGILGLGEIGTALVPIAQGFGMSVAAWGRARTREQARQLGIAAYDDLDNLLRDVDIVSIHLRLTPETRGLLDARRLALLRSGAVLINTSRAGIVDGSALRAALETGDLMAGLDVFEREPLPQDDPLAQFDNVVLSPHIGWVTRDTYQRFISGCVENVAAFLEGRR